MVGARARRLVQRLLPTCAACSGLATWGCPLQDETDLRFEDDSAGGRAASAPHASGEPLDSFDATRSPNASALGEACSDERDCGSGFCSGGICCESACSAVCSSCSQTNTGQPDGICAPALPGTAPVDSCPEGEYCDAHGACAIECSALPCLTDGDCAAAENVRCATPINDCSHSGCEGAISGGTLEAGIAQEQSLTGLNPDDETWVSAWYCNNTLPASADGVLTDARISVSSYGVSGEALRFSVIRCETSARDGVLKQCKRVGISRTGSIDGHGVTAFPLAGATQLDGAPTVEAGIVVQNGDILCVELIGYEAHIACSSRTASGDCGVRYGVQYSYDLETAAEPFDLSDSQRDGVLLVSAVGTTVQWGTCRARQPDAAGEPCGRDRVCDPDVCDGEGNCVNAPATANGTPCSQSGDVCCEGACVNETDLNAICR